jgi:subtilisin
MDPTRRPRRLIVIPPARAGKNAPAPAVTLRRLQAAAAEKRPAVPRMTPSTLKLVTSSPADGAVLLDIGRRSIDEVRASAPDGATLAEEQWYRLERPARPWHKLSEHLKPRPGLDRHGRRGRRGPHAARTGAGDDPAR